MKTEELNALGLNEEQVKAVFAMNGRDIEAQKNLVTSLTAERDGLKSQLDAANQEITSYKEMDIEGIKQKAAEWENKYTTTTKELQDKLDAANYGFAVKEAVSGYRFTSESAKKAFIADLTEKKLPLQEGKLLGLEDYYKSYAESDPGAFVSESDDKTPVFIKGTGGGNTIPADTALRSALGLPTTKKE